MGCNFRTMGINRVDHIEDLSMILVVALHDYHDDDDNNVLGAIDSDCACVAGEELIGRASGTHVSGE